MLEEGVSNHCHERVTVKAVPGPSLKVIETEFFLQLLMCLFANTDHARDSPPLPCRGASRRWCR